MCVSQYSETGRAERNEELTLWCHQQRFVSQCRDIWKVITCAVDTEKTFLDKIIGNVVYSVLLTQHPNRQHHIYTKFLEIRKSSQKAYSN